MLPVGFLLIGHQSSVCVSLRVSRADGVTGVIVFDDSADIPVIVVN